MQVDQSDVKILRVSGATGMPIFTFNQGGEGTYIGFHRYDEIIMTMPLMKGILELHRVL